MVDFILAAEFDNKLGTYIRSTYPKDFDHSCDQILADYMIPDGTHRIFKDYLVFRSVIPVKSSTLNDMTHKLNIQTLKTKLFIYKDDSRDLFDSVQTTSQDSYPFVFTMLNLKF